MVMQVSAITIAINTPFGPQFHVIASKYATGICNIQNQNKFTHVGVLLSPAPLNAFIMQIKSLPEISGRLSKVS